MPLVQLREAREHWRLEDAVAQAQAGNLFPSRIARTAVAGDDLFLSVLDGLALSGFEPRPVHFVSVPKLDGVTRPAADMPIEDEVLLTGIVQSLRSHLQPNFVAMTGEDI